MMRSAPAAHRKDIMALPNNMYPGKCYLCGLKVNAGEGRFERHRGGWKTKHVGPGSKHGVTCEQAKKRKEGTS